MRPQRLQMAELSLSSRGPNATPSCHSHRPKAALDFKARADIGLIG